MKIYNILFLLTALFFTACSSPSANTANTTAQNQSPTAATAASPMDTMRALNEAARIKDTAALKSLVSKATLEMMEANAKQQNATVDELLKKDNGTPFEELPEMRNEIITGETATVEIKDKTSERWVTMPFVKEDGGWKVALDKFIQAAIKQMTEEMKMPASEANTQSNSGKSKNDK